ncbi:MAG: DJ-1 family glyoxalase III [Kiritimatiellia bacterium]
MHKILIAVAEGSEEMEAVITVDVMRRAGWEVTVAAIAPGPVICSRKVKLLPDREWREIDPLEYDALVIPGGAPGVDRLMKDGGVLETLRIFDECGKWICAICAGPLVLQAAGILKKQRLTCHPAVKEDLHTGMWMDEPVVRDGNLITSQGPGTCFEFALTIVSTLENPSAAQKIARGMVFEF